MSRAACANSKRIIACASGDCRAISSSVISNQYTYNGDGQRVQVVDSQGTKQQIWDGENILLETDGAGATQVVYTLEPAG